MHRSSLRIGVALVVVLAAAGCGSTKLVNQDTVIKALKKEQLLA